jgi:hypothetical protein
MERTVYRTSLIAIASLFISAVLVAKAPATEPPAKLEAITVNVILMAYHVADYDTVETLFGKLSLESKKQFLLVATGGASTNLNEMMGDTAGHTLPEIMLTATAQAQTLKEMPQVLEQWAEQKRKQTQLLGRLTLSLFEQPAVVTPYRTHGGVVAAMPQPSPPLKPMMVHPPVPQPAPPGMSPVVVPGHDDGFIALGSYGRVYIKGLEASEIIDAVKFHLSKFLDNPPAGHKFMRHYHIGDIWCKDGSSFASIEASSDFAHLITQVIEPKSWKEEGISIEYLVDAQDFAIRQTAEVHEKLAAFFNQFMRVGEVRESLRRFDSMK